MVKTIYFIYCVLIVAIAQTVCCASEIEDLYAKTGNAFRKGDYDAAIDYLNRLIQLDDPDAYYNRGLAYFEKHEYDKAINDLNVAIHRKPIAHAYEIRGDAYACIKNSTMAIEDYSEAINRAPQNWRPYVARAEQYLFFGNQVDAGLIDCHTAILLLSDTTNNMAELARTYYVQGFAYERKGDSNQAFENYSKSIQFDSEYFLPYVNRGLLFANKSQYDEAINDFKKAIRIAPAAQSAVNRLAWLLATCPNEKYLNGVQALEYSKKACELTVWKDPNCLETYAAANARTGAFEEAIKWESKAIELGLNGKDLKAARGRLELYKQNKPYHEMAKKIN